MHDTLKTALGRLLQQDDLSEEQSRDCIGVIMDGQCDAVEIASFLTAMAVKGPVATELSGAALAMRSRAAVISTNRSPLLDTCGTGGDRLHTFNISTTAALISAACGAAVAKHGNRSVSSSSGSADVLEALGVRITLTPDAAGRCLDQLGIAFCFAPLVHGAMKYAAPVRKQLGFPTMFNLLGPLTNPAGAEYQLLGASSLARAELLAEAVSRLPVRRAFVVCGNDELDEVSLWGETTVFDVRDGVIRAERWNPESFGLPECHVSGIQVQSAAESADLIRQVLAGTQSPARSIAVANAAAALLVCGAVRSLREGVAAAALSIDSGRAADKLRDLISWTTRSSDAAAG
jgi:anthranilate phosphoribosyltransferase